MCLLSPDTCHKNGTSHKFSRFWSFAKNWHWLSAIQHLKRSTSEVFLEKGENNWKGGNFGWSEEISVHTLFESEPSILDEIQIGFGNGSHLKLARAPPDLRNFLTNLWNVWYLLICNIWYTCEYEWIRFCNGHSYWCCGRTVPFAHTHWP